MTREKPISSSEKDTRQPEVNQLVQRLTETEAALQALLSSQTDAVNHPESAVSVLITRAQEALEETNQLLQNILANVYFGIAYLDCDFNFIWVNSAYARDSGSEPEFFIGKNHFDLFPGPEAEAIFRAVVKKGEPYQAAGLPFVFPQYPERGVTYWNWSVQPVKNSAGQVTGILLITVDVTEQKRAELVSQESQALFATLFESAPDANLLVDDEGTILALNRQTELLFGFDRDDLVGQNIEDLVRQDLPGAASRAHFFLAGQGGPGKSMAALVGVRKNRRTFPIEVSFNRVTLSGKPRVICVVRDISVRVRAEQELKEQTGYVTLLQDIAVAANEAETIEGALQFAIDRICQFTGWPVGHAILNDARHGLVSSRLWHMQDPEKYAAFRLETEGVNWNEDRGLPSRIVETGQPAWVENILEDPDFLRRQSAQAIDLRSAFTFPLLVGKDVVGVLEFFTGTYHPLRPDLLQVMAHIGAQLGRVIERERGQRDLQRSESRFRAIFEESTIGIQLNDPEGLFIESNPALQSMLGYSAEELHRFGLAEILHPEESEPYWNHLKALLRGEIDHYQMETRYIRKDGSILWAHLATSLIYDPQGRPQFVVTLVVDITARKKMEAELAEVQSRLEDSVEAERLRLAMELHDGPLQDLYSALFQFQEIIPSLNEHGAITSARNAQSILQQVISSLRSTVGDLRPPTLIPFGLEKAIRSHMDRWRQIYPALKVHLDLMSDGTTLTEHGRLALFRAYQQLISNVARHAGARNMWVRLILQPQEVVLEVEDDGTGFKLPARWLELAREGHTGLLGISERLDAFGGSLSIETLPDHGTRARVTIPRARISAAPPA